MGINGIYYFRLGFLFLIPVEDGSEVTEHQFASDRQYDNSKELTNYIEGCLAQVFGEPVGTDEHQIQNRDTKYQGDAKARPEQPE